MQVAPQATSAMIADLIVQGLINRRTPVRDRRYRELTLTDKGRALNEEALTAWHEQVITHYSGLGEAKIAVLLEILTDLNPK